MHGRLTRTLIALLVIGCAILATEHLWAQCCIGLGHVAGELIVAFQAGTTLGTVESLAASVGSVVILRVLQSPPSYLVRVPIGEEIAFIPIFQAFQEVQYAEPNAVGCFDVAPLCTCCPCDLICDDIPGSCPECAGVIPDGALGQGVPFTVDGLPGGQIRLSWGSPCTSSEGDFAVYEGNLGDFSSHVPVACSTGGLMALTFVPAAGDSYYLVVPRSLSFEGSYGTDSRRLQRPPSPSACLPQGIATFCF